MKVSTMVLAGTGSLLLAGAAHAGYLGTVLVPYTGATAAPAGTVTYRAYAVLTHSLDQVIGLGGDAITALEAQSTLGFYNDATFGSQTEHNAAFDGVVAFLEYDSYWTVGSTNSAVAATGRAGGANWEPAWAGPEDYFANDGGYTQVPTSPVTYGVFDGTNYNLLIGQFTVNTGPTPPATADGVSINGIIGLIDGATGLQVNDTIRPVPTPGALALLGLAGLAARRRRR